MSTVNVKINNISYQFPKGLTILQACNQINIEVPTLCYLKEINEIGACRICVVEVKGAKNLVASCVHPLSEGMDILTHSEKVLKARKITLELILSTHDRSCLSCIRSDNCELQKLCHDFKVDDEAKYDGHNQVYKTDDSAIHMYRDDNKCILCRRCVAACSKLQSVGVIGVNERGFKTHIGCAFEEDLGKTDCVSCGQCIVVCPTGAIAEKDDTDKVWAALADESKHVIVATAPSIRVTLGEAFGMPVGTNVKGKMVTALKHLGFAGVYDTDIAADLTIIEESQELITRIQNGGPLPLITSCSPGWIKFCEHNFHDFIPNLSSCKSPQQMFGAVVKTWYAEKNNLDPHDIVVVSVMPCTAKKFEARRDNQSAAGVYDIDIAITTRELARMIKRAGIQFKKLADTDFDDPLGVSTGAGAIFGATGGVMEAALRTAVEKLTGQELTNLDFTEVRGTKEIKEATYKVGDLEVNVAVTSGLANARQLLNEIREGKKTYHFIEIMGCPGGCINGGGQPVQPASVRNFVDLKTERAKALYEEDKNLPLRKSHESPVIKTLYEEYFGEPGSHKAHKILHTTYKEREY
ncbi:NADH-dependent [FeFe] hydrogenase, group A6 [Proteocatella sphenisci]|uniref:NADH-dependent [FeFe] hydrogenase, group A6 n=1 Tax=Proteocatella sphenisci TaxID=181070 RepID=UPI00048E6672|nr:NADH-dependent [FeFe] hydrogenase, group A6 [Proteocatella sphenisci]